MKEPEQSAQSERTHPPRGGGRPTSIQLVLNWTHVGVFVAVASMALITLNLRFTGIDRRMDERFNSLERRMDERFERVESRLDRVETRLDGVEGELSGINARLAVVEHIVGASASAEVEPPPN